MYIYTQADFTLSSYWIRFTSPKNRHFEINFKILSANSIKWSNTLKQIVWLGLTIIWGWRLNGYKDFKTNSLWWHALPKINTLQQFLFLKIVSWYSKSCNYSRILFFRLFWYKRYYFHVFWCCNSTMACFPTKANINSRKLKILEKNWNKIYVFKQNMDA